jgi:putative endonuclease
MGRGGCFGWTTIYRQGVKHPFVYITASRRNGTLYVRVTSDLARRTAEHRERTIAGFTKRYGCKLLVWMEPHDRIDEAIAREKQIKAGSPLKNEPAQIRIGGEVAHMTLDEISVDANLFAGPVSGGEAHLVKHALHHRLQPARPDVLD